MIFLFYLFLCLIYKKKYLGVQIIIPHLKELNPFYTVLLSIPYDSQFLLVCLLLALWWFSPPVALTLLTPAHGKSPPPSLAWPVCFLISYFSEHCFFPFSSSAQSLPPQASSLPRKPAFCLLF